MSLKVFDTKDAIPESLRDSAVETKDGRFAVADVEGLKSSQERILDEKKRLQAKYEELERSLGGLTAEQVAKYRTDMQRIEDEQARKAGDFDKLLEKRIGETKAEYEKRLAEIEPYRAKYFDRETDLAIRDAATKAGVLPEDLPFVLDIVKGRRVKFDEKAGKVVVVDKDGDVMSKSVEQFFATDFKSEAPKFYGSQVGSGGGSTGSTGTKLPAGQVAASDQKSFLANLDAIAKGQVKVATA